jgi:hypothetical protein
MRNRVSLPKTTSKRKLAIWSTIKKNGEGKGGEALTNPLNPCGMETK